MYVITFTIDRVLHCEYVVSDKSRPGSQGPAPEDCTLHNWSRPSSLLTPSGYRYFKTAQQTPPPKRCTVRTLPNERLPQQRK
jgi:hypothetical protein